ncbi:MAG: RnfABCDGE type electron transport complex subunit B [Lachnospiraceae bacterium]|nr:RnfABCDGE type electron transport complex subunit B [Lachnospiraceae bacterium]
MNGVITALIVVGILGLIIGLFLGVASISFKVEVDEKEVAVLEALPGNNCGGCGFPGCSGLAAAIAKGEAPVDQCPVGGKAVAEKIASIMGVEAGASVRKVAYVACNGDCDKAKKDYEYTGVEDCVMALYVPNGGAKSCNYGCLGFGNCVKACPFDAIHVKNGIAVVDKEACKACGKCVEACPKHLISLIPYDSKYAVACSSLDKGPAAMKKCDVACIGCSLCVKSCENEAVSVTDFNATIDQSKCIACGKCFEKCPKGAIVEL